MDPRNSGGDHTQHDSEWPPILAPALATAPRESMMQFDSSPRDAHSLAAVVARVVLDIDRRDEAQRDMLIAVLLCVAWPTQRAHDQ